MIDYYFRVLLGRALSTTVAVLGGWRILILPPIVFLAGAMLHGIALVNWPELEEIAGKPENEVAIYVLYGFLALLTVGAFVCVAALLHAPYAIYKVQQEQIASVAGANDRRSQERLSRVRSLLVDHAGSAPGRITYTSVLFRDWVQGAIQIVGENLNSTARRKWKRPTTNNYSELAKSVRSMESLAANLEEADLA